ncbi:probable citrate synthase, mitochondrial [Drosophila sechellia]|uniref:Citrate synthase n=2 Tax=melanogaster subgroup TaxID=32351 RepID=B4HHH6_DROSE|nr:probable citrate synthase, mitochondrial [Drosophila sechellia]XP_033167291.1 probable citrate synthase, mitochondrial [Drosophila mauritiana]EDW42515.1 GM26044 [Drosophila sechellia]
MQRTNNYKSFKIFFKSVPCRSYPDCKNGKGKGIKAKLAKKIPIEREKFLGIKCLHGQKIIGQISVNSVIGGMRGLPLLFCETSSLDKNKGIYYRGKLLKDVCAKLPRVQEGTQEGTPEGCFFLLTTGLMPTKKEAQEVTKEWLKRGSVPRYCLRMIDSMDKRVHPMAQLCAASACLNPQSQFVEAYTKGARRADYWKYAYEDSMNLIAMLPTVAASIYANVFKDGEGSREVNHKEDWSGNFCRMLGLPEKDFVDLMRLYMILHADHESGNVSAHACHLVGTALSDPFLSFSASMCGLAGPLHGLANQEVLVWLTKLRKAIGDDPSDEELKKFIDDTLKGGQVIPGYGHAVLRDTDPRFVLQNEFAMKHCKDDPGVKLVTRLWKIIPEVLKKLNKVANPYPNVDAHSGVLLQHYCLKELKFYTVLFGVSRALGVLSQLIWSRALGAPIERPKSFSSTEICRFINEADKKAGKKNNKKKC